MISPQTHRIMNVSTITKEAYDTDRARALKKTRDSYVYELYGPSDKDDPNDQPLYIVAFRYKGQYYRGVWNHTLEEFDGIEVENGIEQITQVYYKKPSISEAA